MDRLIKAKIEPGRVAIQWLGQGGFALKSHAGDVILIDPYLSDSLNHDGNSPRLADILVKPRDVVLDYLFLTHDHIDHTDPQTAPAIAQANPEALIVCPPSSARLLARWGVAAEQTQTCTPGQIIEFKQFVVYVVVAHHSADSVGFVFDFSKAGGDGPIVYITGDSEYSSGLSAAVESHDIDILLVPINGRLGNMTAAEAAKLTREIGPAEVIPMHYGMFARNTADPAEFVTYISTEDAGNSSGTRPIVLKHGSCHIYCPPDTSNGRHSAKKERAERARKGRTGEHQDGVRRAGGRPR